MLVLTRQANQSIVIDGRIVVTVLESGPGGVRLGIDAPKDIRVDRSEVHAERRRSGQEAATTDRRRRVEYVDLRDDEVDLREETAAADAVPPPA